MSRLTARLAAAFTAAAAGAAISAASYARADEASAPHAIYAQGRGPCLLVHDVSIETKGAHRGHVKLIVQPHVGFAAGAIGAECESTLRVAWQGAPGGHVTHVVRSPGQAGDKPQVFDLPTGSGAREILVADNSGSPISLGAAKASVRVP